MTMNHPTWMEIKVRVGKYFISILVAIIWDNNPRWLVIHGWIKEIISYGSSTKYGHTLKIFFRTNYDVKTCEHFMLYIKGRWSNLRLGYVCWVYLLYLVLSGAPMMMLIRDIQTPHSRLNIEISVLS